MKLQDAIFRKSPDQLARQVLLHHDNARPHRARATQVRIQELQWELLEHPPYSLDLAPSDFHLFGSPKNCLGGKCVTDDKEVQMEVQKWLRQQSKDFRAAGFDALVKRWVKYIDAGGGYAKNRCFFHVGISHVLRFISICDLFTDSHSYVSFSESQRRVKGKNKLCHIIGHREMYIQKLPNPKRITMSRKL
jgi:histone-lysine N-methyltransferase SETMAR